MTRSKTIQVAFMIAMAFAASGCSVLKKGKKTTTPVLGQRIAVLTGENDVAVDPATASLPMSLPEAVANTEWRESGGNASQTATDKGGAQSLYGGGIAYDQGRIYATNGLGYVVALDERNGGMIWQVRPAGPLRGSPTIANGAVYVMTQDNQLFSLKEADGGTNWSQPASLEIAGVFGS